MASHRFAAKRRPASHEAGLLFVSQLGDGEVVVFERAKQQLEAAKKSKSGDALMAYWEALNDQLRNLGISPLTLE